MVLLVIGAGYLGLRAYLHSDGFRKFLSAQIGRSARIEGNFAPFNWDGMALATSRFEGTGKEVVRDLLAERISTEVGFGGVRRGVWEIKTTRISRLDVSLNLVPSVPSEVMLPEVPVAPEKPSKKKQPGWVPKKVELESLEIGNLGIQLITSKGLASARGMMVYVSPMTGKNAYKAEVVGGNVTVPFAMLPEMKIQRLEGTYRSGSLFVNQADITALKSGRINASGESNFANKTHAYQGKLEGVTCDELLNENWSRRLTGDVSSNFQFTKRENYQKLSGDLLIQNGTLTALPVLDALAAYADTRRFRLLQLNDARTKWEYSNGEVILSDLVIGSEGLIRLEGRLVIRGEQLDGNFQLGLVPGTLAKIPGAETHVFQPGKMGLLWAPFRLTGTLSDPEEDLSRRLAAVAGARMFEILPGTGEKVFKYTTNVLGESPKVIEKGGKVIEKSADAIREANDLLKGILGN